MARDDCRSPLIVIEVLSVDDSFPGTFQLVRDYLNIGIRSIWLLDPESRAAMACRKDMWTELRRFGIENSPILVDVDTLLAQFA